jgi:hypothetical protein
VLVSAHPASPTRFPGEASAWAEVIPTPIPMLASATEHGHVGVDGVAVAEEAAGAVVSGHTRQPMATLGIKRKNWSSADGPGKHINQRVKQVSGRLHKMKY